jgi:magnesium chelatase accessory protein
MAEPPIDIFKPAVLKTKVRETPPGQLNWNKDSRYWPNRDASKRLIVGNVGWHVQIMGEGPVLLMLHGTGAATHSWRHLMPILAEHFTIIAPDLPGHGFSSQPGEDFMTLPKMAFNVSKLMRRLGYEPVITVGHSAGAAIMTQMVLDDLITPKAMISLNGAMLPLPAPKIALPVLGKLGRTIAKNPLVPFLFSWHASDPKVVEKLITQTGSKIDPEGVKLYAMLAKKSFHVGAALTMMSRWDLAPLAALLTALRTPVLLVAGSNDLTIDPAQAEQLHKLINKSRVVIMPGLGHLAHEEAPDAVAKMILDYATEYGAFAK